MTEQQVPNREDDIVSGNKMSKQFARFIENSTEVLNHLQIIEGDPIGNLETKRRMLVLRQDGGVNTTLYVNEVGDGTSDGWRAL